MAMHYVERPCMPGHPRTEGKTAHPRFRHGLSPWRARGGVDRKVGNAGSLDFVMHRLRNAARLRIECHERYFMVAHCHVDRQRADEGFGQDRKIVSRKADTQRFDQPHRGPLVRISGICGPIPPSPLCELFAFAA